MQISEFMDLSPADRIKAAPILAKYNLPSTAAFQSVIEVINRCGLGALNPTTLLNLSICLDNVPAEELNN